MQQTLSIIKPDATRRNLIGTIIQRLESAHFHIVGMKMVHLNRTQAEGFYAEHKGKPFFDGLVSFMTSGPVVLIVLEGDEVIEKYRELMGTTNPDTAAAGTLRHDYAESMQFNSVHGSDSVASAAREIAYFFAESDYYPSI